MHEENVYCSEMNVFRVFWKCCQILISPGNHMYVYVCIYIYIHTHHTIPTQFRDFGRRTAALIL